MKTTNYIITNISISLLSVVISLFVNTISAQVYNYTTINHFDIETNPAILSSSTFNNQLIYRQINDFSTSNSFNHTDLKISAYSKSNFTGIGLSFTNSSLKNDFSINNIGFGVGYRNVIMNEVFVRLGVFYKLNFSKSGHGYFDFYSFDESEIDNRTSFSDNVNISISFSSSAEKYYISFSKLNQVLPWTNDYYIFPEYYALNLGNFFSLFHMPNSNLSYSLLLKEDFASNSYSYSHYLTAASSLTLTRFTDISMGSNIGLNEKTYIHIAPFVSYSMLKSKLEVKYHLYLKNKSFESYYNSVFQLSLLLML